MELHFPVADKPSLCTFSLGWETVKQLTSCFSFLLSSRQSSCRMSIICRQQSCIYPNCTWDRKLSMTMWEVRKEKPNYGSQNLKNVSGRSAQIYFRFNINSSYVACQYWIYGVGIFTYLISNEESVLWLRNVSSELQHVWHVEIPHILHLW